MDIIFRHIFYFSLFLVLFLHNTIEGCGGRPNFNPQNKGEHVKKIFYDRSRETNKESLEAIDEDNNFTSKEVVKNNKIPRQKNNQHKDIKKRLKSSYRHKDSSYEEDDLDENDTHSKYTTNENTYDISKDKQLLDFPNSLYLNRGDVKNNNYNHTLTSFDIKEKLINNKESLISNKTLSTHTASTDIKNNFSTYDIAYTTRYDNSNELKNIYPTTSYPNEDKYYLSEEIYTDNNIRKDSYNLKLRYDISNEKKENQMDNYTPTSYPNENYDFSYEDNSYIRTKNNNSKITGIKNPQFYSLNKNNTNIDNKQVLEKRTKNMTVLSNELTNDSRYDRENSEGYYNSNEVIQ
uniref:Exported protein n=1 Tax=Strongyloides papillosus TaxID=174720 RepID=A0A0N5B581_STREA